MIKYGAALGRYCPLQLGHQRVIQEMIDQSERSLLFIGSANAPWSLPLFFSYMERRNFIRTIFPTINIVPLPDFSDNQTWLCAIQDILISAGMDPKETTFFGGSDEDVLVLNEEGGYETKIVNRYDGTTPVISASQVRDALIHDRSLEGMLDNRIIDSVREVWNHKWPEFIKKR
jgi:nicotinamide mononucleotide adenylyltransferase